MHPQMEKISLLYSHLSGSIRFDIILQTCKESYQNSIRASPPCPGAQCLCGSPRFCKLFVLHRCRGLGGEVIEDAVDAGNLCDDALHQVVDQVCGQMLDSDFHDVGGVDGADDAGPVKGALAVFDAGGFEIRLADRKSVV